MASVFISYATPDHVYASRIYDGMVLRHIDAWYAPVSIAPGKDFVNEISCEFAREETDEEIENRVEQFNSRNVFVFLLSANSMNSKWCKKELTLAINDNKQIFVLRLDNTPLTSVFRSMLVDIQIIPAYHLPSNVLAELLDEVEKIVGGHAKNYFRSTESHLYSFDIDIKQIAQGDPYFKEGATLLTSLSELEFYLAPPVDGLTPAELKRVEEMDCFAKEDKILDTSLDEVCKQTGISDLKERIERSKLSVIRDFISQRNGCYFNNRKYGINNINPFSRTEDLSERAKVLIEFYTTDYYTHRVMKDVCKQMYTEGNAFLTERLSFENMHPFRILITSLGLNILLVETHRDIDVAALLTRRSTNSTETYGKVNYSLSVVEGVSLSDYDPFTNSINLRLGVERGLMEELGISQEKIRADSIRFLDVFVNLKNLEVGISCTVDLCNDIKIDSDVLGLHGKDEKLEVCDKLICKVSDLSMFVDKHIDEMLPQAAYTIGRYLQTKGNNYLIDNVFAAGMKEEQFIMGKNGSEICGDAIYNGKNFVAVIDGATPKGNLLWDGLAGDVFVARLLKKELDDLPPELDADQAIEWLNNSIISCYKRMCTGELSSENTLQASVVIYSRAKREIWSYGDCKFMVNGALRSTTKAVDELLSRVRSFYLQTEIMLGKTEEELMRFDTGREFILPLLKRQSMLINSQEPYGYPVLNGRTLCHDQLRVIKLKAGDHVVLSSDGYPELYPTLGKSEERLAEIIKSDPLCMWNHVDTKGVKKGNVSYDDRCYISFFIK